MNLPGNLRRVARTFQHFQGFLDCDMHLALFDSGAEIRVTQSSSIFFTPLL